MQQTNINISFSPLLDIRRYMYASLHVVRNVRPMVVLTYFQKEVSKAVLRTCQKKTLKKDKLKAFFLGTRFEIRE